MKKTHLILLAACGVAWFAGCGDRGPRTTYVTIGTGGVTGVYYPAGQAIATMVNDEQDTHHVKASAESTGGSVYNINAVISGDLDFGIAQSDRGHQAWYGLADWEGDPQTRLRSVFSLHPEIVTLVAADDSGIRTLSDLKGKRVNIGNPGSGHRGNALDALRTAGIDPESDLSVESLKAADAPKMLQDGRIDAFFYTVGHPNGAINEATSGKRTVHFVPITGMAELLQESPYYSTVTIPVSQYPRASNTNDVESIGMVTTFLTSDAVPEEVVYALTKQVISQIEEFRALHPALESLTPVSMLEGLTAPIHPGAERCFRELQLLP